MKPPETHAADSVAPSAVARRLDTFAAIIGQIQEGLYGTPFQWGNGERCAYTKKAAALGVTLVTRTTLKIKGRPLKRGARPVGCAYFAAPLSRYADLYVLECQCRPAGKVEPAPAADEQERDEAEEPLSLLLTNAEVERLILMLGHAQPQGFSEDDMTAVIHWAEASRMDSGLLESVLDASMAVSVVNGEVAFKTTAKGMREISSQVVSQVEPPQAGADPGGGKGTLLDTRA